MVKTETLPCGVELVVEEMPHARSVSAGIWLREGSSNESDDQAGISHFVEHMPFKGTLTRTARDLARLNDLMGGHANAVTDYERVGFYTKVAAHHTDKALDYLSDMVLRPLFSPDDVSKEREVIFEEIKMRNDDPRVRGYEQMLQVMWKGSAHGRMVIGCDSTVSAITSDALRAYHADRYTGRNLVVAVAGGVDYARVRDTVERQFESLRPGRVADPAPAMDAHAGTVESVQDIDQCHVYIAVPTFGARSADRFALSVLNTMLGASMSSRLFQKIREERGLAYAVGSYSQKWRDAGIFCMYVGCSPDNLNEAAALAMAEMHALRSEAFGADELTLAKDGLIGSIVLDADGASDRMHALATQVLTHGRPVPIDERLAAIAAVTAEDVLRVAGNVFKDAAIVASVVGPERATQLRFS